MMMAEMWETFSLTSFGMILDRIWENTKKQNISGIHTPPTHTDTHTHSTSMFNNVATGWHGQQWPTHKRELCLSSKDLPVLTKADS